VTEPTSYRIGDFVLDAKRHRLLRGSEDLALPSRAVTVLEVLARRAPEVVGKNELLDAAWSDVAVVEDNLVQAVGALRTALGDSARRPRFIETVHRRGYRLLVTPDPIAGGGSTQRIEIGDLPDVEPAPPRRRVSLPMVIAGAVAAGVVLLAVLGVAMGWLPRPSGEVRSLAVLPMADLSADPEDGYFADGMTDALITELARYSEVRVISRTSVVHYADTRERVPEIARELGVDAIVEGTVTRSGDRMRVIAQLVDARDRHLWGESFERPMDDVLELQRVIAEQIADEIGARLGLDRAAVQRRIQVGPEAHIAYLRGRRVAELRTRDSLVQAIALFETASRLEPAWAQPWLGVADATNLLANHGYVPSDVARPRARHAARRALELDPNLAEAHTALALVEAEYDWDFDAAEADFRRALDLNPSSVNGRSWYAHFLVSQNRIDEALRELNRAHRLDPLSSIIDANIGWFHLLSGEVEVAEQQLRRTLDLDPDFVISHYYLGILLTTTGRHDEAVDHLQRAVELSRDADFTRAVLAVARARSGDPAGVSAIADGLRAEARDRYVSPVSLVYLAVAEDDRDAAFAALEAAFDERKGWLLHLRYDPLLEGLRTDPRFEDLAQRVGLPV
jgi:TolB-like protein/DNA-binding winged helix-turn-helix (wHTH) protein/Tfp pilus assembly protein PilF